MVRSRRQRLGLRWGIDDIAAANRRSALVRETIHESYVATLAATQGVRVDR